MSNFIEKSRKTPVTERTISELVFENADKFADKLAQLDITTGETDTFKNLKLRSIRLAMQLHSKFNLTPKDVILTCVQNSVDSSLPVIAGIFLGCKVGNLHPSLSVWQTTYLLNLMEAAVLFIDSDGEEIVKQTLKDVKKKPKIIFFGESEYINLYDLLSVHKDENKFIPARVSLDDVVFIFFSSGTTGLPKGICHSHRSFMAFVTVEEKFREGIDVQLHLSTFYWISGMLALMRSFLYGRTRAFCKEINASAVLAAIEKYKINCIFSAPIYTAELVNSSDFENFDTSSMKRIVVGGTAVSVVQIKTLQTAFPQAKIFEAYGLTECGIITLLNCKAKNKLKTVGELVEGVKLKIVDPTSGQVLDPNLSGEIYVQAPQVMVGYYRQDSSQAFDEEGWLKTGDVGYYDEDKYLYIVGRLKEMFKYKSWHVVPAMIEAILEDHPAVEESVVFGMPSKSVEDGDLPSACIVLKQSCKATEKEIKQFVAERVSDTEQLRGIVVFVDSLPRGPTGKVVRADVREMMMKRFSS